MMRRKPILRVTSKVFMPFILIYALYVQFHGDFGPGGGFQAGVIFGSSFILYALIFGLHDCKLVLPATVLEIMSALGVLLYAGVGVVSFFMGDNFLNYNSLAHDPLHGQHYGILLVELGVGMTVFSSMTLIFYIFAGRGR
ncbi:Na+/H+ antiporter MnhB subunit-related protein (fragment) [Candidatus Terasakiella magnetica]|uniref:Na+/H+ antiporter MnhB subunit-related protein n=1 Tax=Candidatus Terasakiella magnetica TaxID=1867952 RepID=A0A1C3RCG5_9PROT